MTAGQDHAAGGQPPRRPVRSRVRHGQASCADYGCARAGCREAALRARRRRDSDRAQGLAARVDAGPAALLAAVLVRRGMSAQDIADTTGISVTLVRRLLRTPEARPARIARSTAEAVLGVPLPGPGRTPARGRGLTSAEPAAVALTELALQGWPATYLAARLDTSAATVAAVRDRSRRRITVALDVRIHRLRLRLVGTTPVAEGVRPGDAARTRAWALRAAGRRGRCPEVSRAGVC
ncbi:hypothetical protein [Kitasatospora paracochleata]|uniref:Uncharacterized protein n=1 Tax=Kitasatospora paracochleata TaxID=58354 RepID=A0ABT1J9F9_9ACTN|nr:hypothetical protein [Kitasatospora paracochleata]MCP2314090.1 hypothetical protein [Kitasatospora paracochleata]